MSLLSADRPSFDIYVQKRVNFAALPRYVSGISVGPVLLLYLNKHNIFLKDIHFVICQNMEAKEGPLQRYAMPLNRWLKSHT